MFSLIIAIISIALVVAAVALGAYYGGSSISEAEAQAQAARLKNEEHQIIAAVDSFQADQGRWPADIPELVARGYLNSVPRGAPEASLGRTAVEFIAWAQAQDAALGWSTPVVGVPIYTTSHSVAQEVCRKYNSASRGDDGILKNAFTGLKSQCFGEDGSYTVVITRAASASSLSSALPATQVSEGYIPTADAGTVWWDVAPSGAIKVPTDPAKVPRATLELHPATAEDFGELQVGDITAAESRTVINSGNTSALGLQVTVPEGFSLSSNSCGTELTPRGSCSFTVQFQPSSASPYSGTVTVTSDNGGTQAYSVSGSGRGASATLDAPVFGNVAAGQSVERNALVTNTGIGLLALGTPEVSGDGFSFAGGSCGSSLAVGDSCSIKVRLTASGMTAHAGLLRVPLQGAEPLSAGLSGQSQQAAVSVSPASKDFGGVAVNFSSTSTGHTLTNTGNLAATGLGYLAPTGFQLTANTCSTSLNPGASCTFNITFVPKAAQTYNSAVTITSSNAAESSVAVQGSGLAATLSNIAYGNQAAGSSTEMTSTLTNTSPVAISITAPTSSSVGGGSFSYVSTTCGASLNAGESCTVTVRYSASGVAAASGTLSLTTSAGVKSATLSGQSTQATLVVSPTSRNFGSVASGSTVTSATHTLTNNGNVPANALTLTPPQGYTLANNTCASTLANGTSCSFAITFSPTAVQSYNSSVDITASNGPATKVWVYGTGTAAATYSASQFALVAYGQYGVDDLYWTIKNNTGANVTVTAITFSGFDEGAGITINGVTYAVSAQYGGTQKVIATSTWAAGATQTLYMDQAEATLTLHLSNGQALTFNVSWSG